MYVAASYIEAGGQKWKATEKKLVVRKVHEWKISYISTPEQLELTLQDMQTTTGCRHMFLTEHTMQQIGSETAI